MAISPFHLIVLGTLASIGGALLIAKAYWWPSLDRRTARHTIEGSQPFLIRREILQHSHTMAGVRWLVVGTVALFFGMTRRGETFYFIDPWTDVFLHVVVLSFSWVATLTRTKGISRRAYIPKIIDLYRQGFELHLEYLVHQGCRRSEIEQGVQIHESVRQRRLSEVSSGLDQIGRLIDVPRRNDESDHQYAGRLRLFFHTETAKPAPAWRRKLILGMRSQRS
ncbi:MAG: hypothetical protein C4293_10195 [Nitrospiraceae bacterium]